MTISINDVLHNDPSKRALTHVVTTVTSAGDTVVHIPTPGKKLHVYWIYALNDPDSTASPLIKIRIGSAEKYRAWALAKTQYLIGGIDESLVVNLSMAANVAFTALVEEE